MLARTIAALAFAGSAAAFSPAMSMDLGRREAVQAGAAVAVAAPLLRPNSAGAYDIEGGGEGRQALSLAQRAKFRNEAPMITVFDHRGCKAHTNTEYKGKRAGNQDDEMLVKVQMGIPKTDGDKFTQENLSMIQQKVIPSLF